VSSYEFEDKWMKFATMQGLPWHLFRYVVAIYLFVLGNDQISRTSVDSFPFHRNGGRNDPLVVTVFGDSITLGADGDKRASSYPKQLQEKLGSKEFHIMNLGFTTSLDPVPGAAAINPLKYVTTGTGTSGTGTSKKSKKSGPEFDFCSWRDRAEEATKHGKPDIAVIQFGTSLTHKLCWNETRFITDYIDMIEKTQKLRSHPALFICIPPPAYCNTGECALDIQPEIVNNRLPALISLIAHKTGAFLVDNFGALGGQQLGRPDTFFAPGKVTKTEWKRQNKFPYDGIHPNVIGNTLMAHNIATEIQKQLRLLNATFATFRHGTVPVDLSQTMSLIQKSIGTRAKYTYDEVYPILEKAIAIGADAHAAGGGGGQTDPVTATVVGSKHDRNHGQPSKASPSSSSASASASASTMFPPPLREPPFRPVIACVGDSITEGVGSRAGESGQTDVMSYPAVLQRQPGFQYFQGELS
jgi:lysophospholipase L1-like esterase